MTQPTFLFYDIETSGLHPAFDQIIQFAAIRTDLDLNELARYTWLVKPNIDVIPSPRALILHRTPWALWQQGEPEGVVIQRIHALFNTPGTISLGYNTLGFDDEFLRFSFYRNLLMPYTHQYLNRCYRADLYPLTTFYYLFHHDSLRWPKQQQKVSLKLEQLNAENHLSSGAAHTAMVDVEATLALAKKLQPEKKTWAYLLGYFDKIKDAARIEQLPLAKPLPNKFGLMIDGLYGAPSNFCVPVLQLGVHRHYKNQHCWLRLDNENLIHTTPDNVKHYTWVTHKKLGEPGFLLPPKPIYTQKLSGQRIDALFCNLAWLHKNPEVMAAIKNYYLEFTYPRYDYVDPSAQLYLAGFWTTQEQRQCQHFQGAAWEQKRYILEKFTNPLLKQLAIRVVARFDLTLLSQAQRTLWAEDQAYQCQFPEKVLDYKGQKKLTSNAAQLELEQLLLENTLDAEQQRMLIEYATQFYKK